MLTDKTINVPAYGERLSAPLIHPDNQKFTREIVSPDDISRESAIARARLLDGRSQFRMWLQSIFLEVYLVGIGVKRGVGMVALVAMLVGFIWAKDAQKLKLVADLRWRVKNASDGDITALKHAGRLAMDAVKPIQDRHKRYEITKTTLNAMGEAKRRNDLEKRETLDAAREAANYESIIRSTWGRLAACHHRQIIKGVIQTKTPKFQVIYSSPYFIWFRIATAYKSLAGFNSALPYNVYVKDLLSTETLFELQAATGRVIEAIYPDTENGKDVYAQGYLLKLTRTDTPGGIVRLVTYGDIMDTFPSELRTKGGELLIDRFPIPVGVGEGNVAKWLNFVDFAHWLVAGTTGAGKSNFLNVLLSVFISRYSPKNLRLVLVDLKMGTELAPYRSVPHVLGDIAKDVRSLSDTLLQLQDEMMLRYRKFEGAGCRDIRVWNKNRPTEHLPRIIIVIDEFAETVGHKNLSKEIVLTLQKITSMGRAAGIHVLLCTQDPRVEVIPGVIKANLPVKIAGWTSSVETSRVILGTGDAAKIPKLPGRMLMKINEFPVQIQTPLITDSEIKDAIAVAMEWDKDGYELPERIIREEWTLERIVQLSLDHFNGALKIRDLYDEIKVTPNAVSRPRLGKIIADEILPLARMGKFVHKGQMYKLDHRQRNQKYLVLSEDVDMDNED